MCVKAPAAATDTTARLETRENMNRYAARVVGECDDPLAPLNTQGNKSSRKQNERCSRTGRGRGADVQTSSLPDPRDLSSLIAWKSTYCLITISMNVIGVYY